MENPPKDLFTRNPQKPCVKKNLPLAVRMRPRNLSEYVGQNHILGEGKLLSRAIKADRISSLILYGPPGVGKTSLAACIAATTKSRFVSINATTSNTDQLRKIIAEAQKSEQEESRKTILFIDEIHRFNKAVQDVLMPNVEEANPVLIGATVHNPFFYLTAPLVSRSIVFELKPLLAEEIARIVQTALSDKERGLAKFKVRISNEAVKFIAKTSEGDARRALSALEIGVLTTPADKQGVIDFDLAVASESMQKKAVIYDRDEDAHYDTASAFIKSMRGSDPDATIYWMAKMLYAGEDPRFIARRICICASEDVGNADPLAIILAQSALNISEFVGMPEARIILAQAALYVACAEKSNAAYLAIEKAMSDVEKNLVQPVPDHLKDSSYKAAKTLGHGQNYKYAHDYNGHYVKQKYTQHAVTYYQPSGNGYEAKIKERLEHLRKNH
jgi:putative ATPase